MTPTTLWSLSTRAPRRAAVALPWLALLGALASGCDHSGSGATPDATPPADAAGERDAATPPGDAGDGAAAMTDAGASDAATDGSRPPPADGSIADPGPAPSGTIWYVRHDGGNRTQCDGQGDTGYAGTGDHQHCAFGDVRDLWTDGTYGNKAWVIAGGDTVIVRDGPWRVGQNGPNAGDSFGNNPGDPYGAGPPPLPSGTATQPTRIYGEHWAHCTTTTQLFGGYAVGTVLSLAGSSHVDVECLELTDHAQCTRVGAPAEPSGCSSSYPLDDYASVGIGTDAHTADAALRNVDIHGFTSRGIIGPIGGVVTVDHLRIGFNAGAGWDFDDGAGTPSAPGARVDARALTIEWSGCNEEYPITYAVPAVSCYDQDHAGYGDGVGTPNTALDFTCDGCVFRYNTQDGLDLLHTSGSTIAVTHSRSYGNMGQQWKFGAMASVLFTDNLTVHDCHRLADAFPGAPSGYNANLSLFCRAAGDGIALSVTGGGRYRLAFDTLVTYGATTFDIGCQDGMNCPGATMEFEDNIVYGYASPVDGQLPGIFYFSNFASPSPWTTIGHNLYYNPRHCPTDADPTAQCVDPHLASTPAWSGEASLDAVDMHLASGSPAIGHGVAVGGVADDYEGHARPAAPSIGAYEP